MKGFKNFLLRGNLIELAVAFIMAAAFGAVVTSFTELVMDIIGTVVAQPDFSALVVAGVNVGRFITAVVALVIMSAVVYFFIVRPYERFTKQVAKEPVPSTAGAPTSEELLSEIRDLLKSQAR